MHLFWEGAVGGGERGGERREGSALALPILELGSKQSLVLVSVALMS